MFNKKITRREFMKIGALGILAALAMPIFRMFRKKNNVSHKDAAYYKKLAG